MPYSLRTAAIVLAALGCHSSAPSPTPQPPTPTALVADAVAAAQDGDWAKVISYVDTGALARTKAQFLALADMMQSSNLRIFANPDSTTPQEAGFYARVTQSFATAAPFVALLGDSLPALRDLTPAAFASLLLARMDSLDRQQTPAPRIDRYIGHATVRDSTAEVSVGPEASVFDRLHLVRHAGRWYLDDSFAPFFLAFLSRH